MVTLLSFHCSRTSFRSRRRADVVLRVERQCGEHDPDVYEDWSSLQLARNKGAVKITKWKDFHATTNSLLSRQAELLRQGERNAAVLATCCRTIMIRKQPAHGKCGNHHMTATLCVSSLDEFRESRSAESEARARDVGRASSTVRGMRTATQQRHQRPQRCLAHVARQPHSVCISAANSVRFSTCQRSQFPTHEVAHIHIRARTHNTAVSKTCVEIGFYESGTKEEFGQREAGLCRENTRRKYGPVAGRRTVLWVGVMAAFINSVSLFTSLSSRVPFRSLSSTRSICARRRFKMSQANAGTSSVGKVPEGKDVGSMTDTDWRSVLTAQEYKILRKKGTEYPGTGEYDAFYPTEGHFVCRACGNALYSAQAKFKSGCGWPAFDKCYKDSIKIERDVSFGMVRVEIMCNRCGGHLGHVFEGERFTKTNERHCVNSASVKYVEGSVDKEEEKVL